MPEALVDKWFTWNYCLPYRALVFRNSQQFQIERIAAYTAEAFERDGTGDLYDTGIDAWVWTASEGHNGVTIRVSVPLRALTGRLRDRSAS